MLFQLAGMTVVLESVMDREEKRKENVQFTSEKETCIKYFEKWNENHQIEFVQHLLSRMCHYQHGHINTYLKPMLQRDFISLLPSMFIVVVNFNQNFAFKVPL